MNVLTMQLNSITIMDLIAASLQIRKHKSKATETVKRKACRKRWLLFYENLILRFIALKIYHMKEQVERPEASAEHKAKCQAKLDVLLEQQVDLSTAIDQLLEDIEAGRKYMKVYRQMKMYNDPSTNPVLYKK